MDLNFLHMELAILVLSGVLDLLEQSTLGHRSWPRRRYAGRYLGQALATALHLFSRLSGLQLDFGLQLQSLEDGGKAAWLLGRALLQPGH